MRPMTDSELIQALGGPTRVAELLGLSDRGAIQRVSNWKRRGIPPRMRLDHPRVFAIADARDVAPEVPAAHEAA